VPSLSRCSRRCRRQVERQARGGCPIGSLAGQLAERDDGARLALADGFRRWEEGLRDGLETMAARGELRKDADPSLLAKQTLAALARRPASHASAP
jgi:hypothetical protein